MTERSKQTIDIERLLQWAYRDELSKRQTSAAEGVWDAIAQYGQRGGIDPGHVAAQRYSHFGVPDADALTIEKAVGALRPVAIDWQKSLLPVAGDLAGLVTINDLDPARPTAREVKGGWEAAGDRALRAFFGPAGAKRAPERRRDVIMVASLQPAVLVTTNAIKARRPNWRFGPVQPKPTPAAKGPLAQVIGECKGKNLYTVGSHCPLIWEPSPISIIQARADYVVWWEALASLAASLDLVRYAPTIPAAPPLPWFDDFEPGAILQADNAPSASRLPIQPERDRALAPLRRPKAGPARSINPGDVR